MFRAQQELLEARRSGQALQGANERRRKVSVSHGAAAAQLLNRCVIKHTSKQRSSTCSV